MQAHGPQSNEYPASAVGKIPKHPFFTPCLDLCLYSHREISELTPSTSRVFDRFNKLYAPSLRFFSTDRMKVAKRINADTLDIPRKWQGASGSDKDELLSLEMFAGDSREIRPPAIRVGHRGIYYYLQISIPVPDDDGKLNSATKIFTDVASDFPFDSGHAGLSFLWNARDSVVTNELNNYLGPQLLRHPGMFHGNAKLACLTEINPINWMTFLSTDYIQKLGGVQAIKSHLEDGAITVQACGGGILILAGLLPRCGDINREEPLISYRKVGKYLKPIRQIDCYMVPGLDKEKSEDWLARFDT